MFQFHATLKSTLFHHGDIISQIKASKVYFEVKHKNSHKPNSQSKEFGTRTRHYHEINKCRIEILSILEIIIFT